jgi:hypothetical protein
MLRETDLLLREGPVKFLSVSLALAAGFAGAVSAQEAPPSSPPLLTVRPSGYDERTDEARAREDRLYRRMQQNDFLFRNICVHCGGGVNRAGANAPFNPIQALGPAQRRGLESEQSSEPLE